MKRTIWIAIVAAWAVQPVVSQQLGRAWPPPLDPIPVEELAGYERYVAHLDLGSLADSLSDDQLARRFSRLYSYQSRLLMAQAAGDISEGARILRIALAEIEGLSDQPAITDNVRFRELFRSIVTEHDFYYGKHMEQEYGSVFTLREDIFEVLDRVENPLAAATTPAPRAKAVKTTVPMTENQSVEQLRNWFLKERRDHLIRWMGRAETYFPAIEQILKEEGVPDELKYLAVIESGLRPKPRSPASAVGMWQFMGATGRAYGLDSDAWVDERMDPIKATRAAARHLKDLYSQYDKNWHVALAGYNCSPRCIKRAIRANGGVVDFWGMYKHLNPETRAYVPQFIAVAQIMSNPTAFGLPATVSGPAFAYDVVPVTGMLSVETIAGMVGTTEAEIQRLNPELRRNYLPPNTRPYELRIPPGSAQRFAAAFDKLPPDAKRRAAEHVVRRGDNLGKIGNRYGVSVRDLMVANNLRRTTIYPGQHLVVPVAGGGGGEASLSIAGVRTVDWGKRVNQPIQLDFEPKPLMASTTPVRQTSQQASQSSTAASRSSASKSIRYQVRRGDTLSELAAKYATSATAIRRENNLRSSRINRGQWLTITPGKNSTIVHVVQRGENLTRIAEQYRTTVSSIRTANNLGSTTILPGQQLTIMPGKNSTIVHVVQRGENLTRIAEQYRTTVSSIRTANNLGSTTIRPGQRLTIQLP